MTISAVGSAGFRETALAARVELVHGDMFEGPSDLVVLPCSEVPTVAPFVERRLKQFQIPALGAPMKLGEVRFLDLGAASQIAPTAAYAASVRKGVGSEVGAIESIAAALGTYALANRRVHLVAAPLLGTGAGELAPRDSFEAIRHGFLNTAPHGATLRVYVPSAREFAELERIEAAQPTRLPTPRVFISYTKTDEQHAAWVQNLAEWLLANGVEARLDVWDLSPGMDVAQWMSNELDLADRVLLICNEEYASRADRRHGGVGWEIRLVQGVLLGSQSDNPDKFIPIVRAADVALGSPGFLRSAYCLHWPPGLAKEKEVAERTKLLRHLFRLRTKPPLGEPPDFIRAATAGSLSTKKGRPERRALTETSGRASTQIFLDAGDKPGKEAREALKQAIAAHRKRFEDNPAENTGHGVNLVALLTRARRLGLRAAPDLKPKEVAQEVVAALEATPESRRDEWFLPTLAEASLGLGDWDAVERNVKAYAAAPDAKAFQIASTLRQFTEVWDLEATDERGRGLVATLRARLLQLPGGGLEIAPDELQRLRAQPAPDSRQLEALLGTAGAQTYRWWKTGLGRALAVAAIRRQLGGRLGTGFLVRAADVGLEPGDELLVMTNFHVVNPDGASPGVKPEDAEVVFEAADPDRVYLVDRIVWSSPIERHDATVLRLQTPVEGIAPLPVAKTLPAIEDTSRVYVIGHPDGRDLAFSFQDNELLDHEGPPAGKPQIPDVCRVHYRAPTEGGSSGGPVFNASLWQVIALHRSGGIPRLNGVQGEYAASEGISLQSIKEAIGVETPDSAGR